MTDRKSLFIRVDADMHRRVVDYASTYDFSLNDVVVCLIEQLLVQVDPTFPMPAHLGRFFRRREALDEETAPKS